MGRMLRRAAGTALVAALATGVAGCAAGGDPAIPDDGSRTSARPSASGSPTSAPSAPPGTVLVRAERSGLRFAVPEAWEVADVATVLEAGVDEDLAAMAERMNVPASQLRAAARTIDVSAFGPSVDGFAPNVNVQGLPVEEVPSAAQLRLVTSMIGGTVESVDDVPTPVGPGRVSRYRAEIGGRSVVGRQLGIEGPSGVVLVTVTATTAAGADDVLALLQRTLTTT
ncbi:hypothetical protein [Phycicoccus sonneratiae]|uniref:Lipoprotein n=1 Tax=Phycicoccus sonneratiae TaxID=2807628 RepID=A0ABS2CMY4_9MICO|nr:hypothetical protein [Phycicoccus sonneraticus]MBM6401239.1 hypothetical protein [Phycicoccus sonneraticus]